MKIRMSHMIDIIYPVTLSNFVLTHQDFVDPDYVLRDSVTLLQVTKDTAIFIEGKKGMPPAFSMSHSFSTLGQIVTGEYIIVMSLPTFLRLSDKLEDNGSAMVFLHNTARCGGSLMCNILEHTGQIVAWNEPRVLDNICTQINHSWNRIKSKQILKAGLKMLAKPYGGLNVSNVKYVIKVCCIMTPQWALFQEAIPRGTHVFVYRDLNATAQSLCRVMPTMPICMILYIASLTGNPFAVAFLYHYYGFPPREYKDMPARYDYLQEYGYRSVLYSLRAFKEMRKSGIAAFKYEDLVSHSEQIIGALLAEVGLERNLVSRASKAMDMDSQAKSPFNQQKMKKAKEAEKNLFGLDPEFLEDMQQEFEQAGVPGPYDWNEDFRLPGTVVPQEP